MAETDVAAQATDASWPENVDARLNRLGKANMNITVVLGRARLPLEEVLNLGKSSIVELDRVSGQPVDILVNNTLFGRGEVVVVGDNIAIRINQLFRPEDMAVK